MSISMSSVLVYGMLYERGSNTRRCIRVVTGSNSVFYVKCYYDDWRLLLYVYICSSDLPLLVIIYLPLGSCSTRPT
jgi:hypothetical protein